MTNDSHANDLRCRADLLQDPGFLLAKGWQLAWNLAAGELADLNLTPQQVGLLICLSHSEGITQRDLAEAMVIDGATMTGLVTRLERSDLICRERDTADRRLMRLQLTDEGRTVVAHLVERIALVEARFHERLGESGVAELCRLLCLFLGWNRPEDVPVPIACDPPAESHASSAGRAARPV